NVAAIILLTIPSPLIDRSLIRTCWGSIRADAGLADRPRPALDLLGEELRQISGRAALGRYDFAAELLQPLADAGVVKGVAHRLVELAHDRLGRPLRQEER